MQVLFVFYHSDKTDKLDCFIHASAWLWRRTVQSNSCCMYWNCVEFPLAVFTHFGSIVKKPASDHVSKVSAVLVMIQRIHLRVHLRCGSCGSIIRFWILVKKQNIRFRIKSPDSLLSKDGWYVDHHKSVDVSTAMSTKRHYETSQQNRKRDSLCMT